MQQPQAPQLGGWLAWPPGWWLPALITRLWFLSHRWRERQRLSKVPSPEAFVSTPRGIADDGIIRPGICREKCTGSARHGKALCTRCCAPGVFSLRKTLKGGLSALRSQTSTTDLSTHTPPGDTHVLQKCACLTHALDPGGLSAAASEEG